MTTPFYDTHAHLDFPEFASDLPQVLERAQAAGIAKIISIGTDLAASERALRLSERFPAVYAAVGWHPAHAAAAPDDLRPALRKLAAHPRVVAIGEIGLDYHHLPSETPGASPLDDEAYKRKQAAAFRQQMEVAAELGLNCIVHQRDAWEDVLTQMQPFVGRLRGVFHCFVNNAAAARRVLALGCLVSFTGIVTFRNAPIVRETLASLPPDGFMLETDCPFLAPVPYRGKRCEPAYVKEIAQAVAQTRDCSLDALSAVTCATAERFFPGLKTAERPRLGTV